MDVNQIAGNLRGHTPLEKPAFGGSNVGTVVLGWRFPDPLTSLGLAADCGRNDSQALPYNADLKRPCCKGAEITVRGPRTASASHTCPRVLSEMCACRIPEEGYFQKTVHWGKRMPIKTNRFGTFFHNFDV